MQQLSVFPRESQLANAVDEDFFIEHGRWANPHSFFTVQCAVKCHRLQRFAVPHRANHFIEQVFVVAVQAGRSFDQRRKFRVHQQIVVKPGYLRMRHANFIEETAKGGSDASAEAGFALPRLPGALPMAQVWIVSCLLVALAIVGWLGVQLARGEWVWVYAGLGSVAVFLLWIGLAALRQMDEPAGVMLTAVDAPALFDALERLRKKLRGPRIGRVVLNTQFGVRIQVQRCFGGNVNALTIGLPLLLAMDRRRVLALIAHEYACFQGGYGRFGQWFFQGLHGFGRLHLMWRAAPGLATVRQREIEADRLARKLLGRHVAAAALIEYTVKADWMLKEFWPGHWRAASASLKPLPPFAAMRILAAVPPSEDFAQESLRRALARDSDPEDSLSLLRDRLDALRAGKQLPAWSCGHAISLLGDRGSQWVDDFDHQWCRDNAAEWKLHRTYLGRVRVRGQWLARRFRRSTANDLLEVAGLMRRLDVDAEVRELYERALHLTPGHSGALRGLLQCMPVSERDLRLAFAGMLFDTSDSHRGWASRVAVATLEKNRRPDGAEDSEAADDSELARWRDRRDRAEEMERRAQLELARATCFDAITPGDLNEFEKGELLSRLARCRPVARAWLVRKELTEFARLRCYIVFVELAGGSQEERSDLCRELERSLELPGLTRVVSAGRSPTLSQIGRSAFDPVYVRAPD
jgi:hypothetical protein